MGKPTITGTVDAIDPMDAGRAYGLTISTGGTRSTYLRLPSGDEALTRTITQASNDRSTIEIAYEPLPLRLGMPLGEVVSALPRAA